jgi:uncharacterized Zn-finger protein
MELLKIEKANTTSVCCNGREAPYDHPKVYLKIDPKYQHVLCPYCGKQFVLEE